MKHNKTNQGNHHHMIDNRHKRKAANKQSKTKLFPLKTYRFLERPNMKKRNISIKKYRRIIKTVLVWTLFVVKTAKIMVQVQKVLLNQRKN